MDNATGSCRQVGYIKYREKYRNCIIQSLNIKIYYPQNRYGQARGGITNKYAVLHAKIEIKSHKWVF